MPPRTGLVAGSARCGDRGPEASGLRRQLDGQGDVRHHDNLDGRHSVPRLEGAVPFEREAKTSQCLVVTIIYNYSESPLFPELPGLGLITPSTITSTNIIQLGTVS